MNWPGAVSLGAPVGHALARNDVNLVDPRIAYLIRLRALAALRSLRAELGSSPVGTVLALAMLLAGAGAGGLLALRAVADPRSAAALAALGPTVASGVHAWRRDPGLLRRAHVPTRTLFVTEYGLLALPLAAALGLAGRPVFGLASVAAAGLVAMLPTRVQPRQGGRRAKLPIGARWWSQAAFEWTRTTRRGRTWAAVAVVGGTLGGIVRPDLPFVPLVAVAIITLATLDGYVGATAAEGWDLVSAYARAPARFLARKVGLVVAAVGPVLLVPTLAFAAAAPTAERLAVAVGAVAFALAIVATGIAIKYAYYRPGEPPPPVAVIVWLAASLCALAQAPLLAPFIGAYLARRAVATVAPYLSVATGRTPVPRWSRPPHGDPIDEPHAASVRHP